jgi:endonuclease/exonuclease/phosphatase family metal-dependent hydrolase
MPRNSKLLRRYSPLLGLLVILTITYLVGDHPVSTGPAEGTKFSGPPATRSASSDRLMIATFNIDSGKGEDGKVDLARTARCLQMPDFVGMNEVHGFLWGEPKNQAETLSNLLHLPYLWVPVEKRWGQETFGNAAFTDLPVTHWQRVVLPTHRFGAKRNYLLTDVLWHGKTVHILTTHTDWKPGGEEQFKIVRDVFLKLPTPAILMGDLNTPASSELIKGLKATPGVEEAVDQIYDTIPGRVDWIFLRGLHTKDAAPVNLKASDHPAYWASVVLK